MDDELAWAYERCRLLHRRHGRTYYLATRLLPAAKRRHVHALYGFTRYADEIVDSTDGLPTEVRTARLNDWADRFRRGDAGDPILRAVLHTIETFDMDGADFLAFLRSMAMDLDVRTYATYTDLLDYMEGSAAVIGTMMLPILDPADPVAAREPARELGLAFQLTNFIRDVAEDLERDRIYLPQEDLALFGVTEDDLRESLLRKRSPEHVRRLIRFEMVRAREHYERAAVGVPMLAPTSQACIRTAFHLYAGILIEVEKQDYDVFGRRAVVPSTKRLRVAAQSFLTPPGPAPVVVRV